MKSHHMIKLTLEVLGERKGEVQRLSSRERSGRKREQKAGRAHLL